MRLKLSATYTKRSPNETINSHGAVRCFIKRKSGLEKIHHFCWIEVDWDAVRIDGQFSMEDLLSNDWILEEDVV